MEANRANIEFVCIRNRDLFHEPHGSIVCYIFFKYVLLLCLLHITYFDMDSGLYQFCKSRSFNLAFGRNTMQQKLYNNNIQ